MHKKHGQAPTDMRTNSHPKTIMKSHFSNPSGKRQAPVGLWALFLVVCTLGFAFQADAGTFEGVGKSIVSEASGNGVIDPGEIATVTFNFKNSDDSERKKVKISLKSDTGNVAYPITGKVDLGTIGKKASFSATFQFRADGPAGGTLAPDFVIEIDGDANQTLNKLDKFEFFLGEVVSTSYSFSNTASITINDFKANDDKAKDNGRAGTYPSEITTSGIPLVKGRTGERIRNTKVTLHNVTHGFSRDIGAVLVSPKGDQVALMRNAGGATTGTAALNNVTITFDQSSDSAIPANAQITSTSYDPADYGTGELIAGKAPTGAYSGSLGAFTDDNLKPGVNSTEDQAKAKDPNGKWKLYIVDNSPGGNGAISEVAGGWTLEIITEKVVASDAGATAPYIVQGASGARVASIAKVDILEDTVFESDDPSKNTESTNGNNHPEIAVRPVIIVADLETAGKDLTVTAVSGSEGLIKSSNIKLIRDENAVEKDGTDDARKFSTYTLDFKPEVNQVGVAAITITVTDASGLSSSSQFDLTIVGVNDLPTFPVFPRNQAFNTGNQNPPALSFTIADVETPVSGLIVTAATIDAAGEAIVPSSGISLTTDPTNPALRTITIRPASSSTTGETSVVVSIKDANNDTTTKNIVVNFDTPAGRPTISPFAAVEFKEDGSKSIDFTLRSGSSTPVNNLVLSASIGDHPAPQGLTGSSTPATLIPLSGVTFSGTGEERTVTIRSAADLYGDAAITLTAADGATVSPGTVIQTKVLEVNDKPTITAIGTQTIDEDSATGDITFSITDKETAIANVVTAGTSFNQSIVADGDIVVTGTDANRTVKVTAVADGFGRTTITITATDIGGKTGNTGDDLKPQSATASFDLFVNAVNDPPTITQIVAGNDISAARTAQGATIVPTTQVRASRTTALQGAVDGDGNPVAVDAVEINEDGIRGYDAGQDATTDTDLKPDGDFVDPAKKDDKGINKQYLTLDLLGPGKDEFEQTVTITATTDKPELITGLRITKIDNDDEQKTISFSQGSETGSRRLRYIPVRHAYGTATITLTLTDNGVGGANSTTRKFKIKVNAVNDSPSLDAISDIGVTEVTAGVDPAVTSNQGLQIPIKLSDQETSKPNIEFLTPVVNSGGSTVSASRITVDPSRSVIAIVPTANSAGTANITVSFTDRGETDDPDSLVNQITVNQTFEIRFKDIAPNQAPSFNFATLAADVDSLSVAIDEDNVATASLDSITDDTIGTGGVTFRGNSSNQSIVKDDNILFGGVKTDTSRSIAIVPEANANGTVTISISATDVDGVSSAPKTITLGIRPVEDSPTISLTIKSDSDWSNTGAGQVPILAAKEEDNPIPDDKTDSKLIEVKISDPETSGDSLSVTVTSKNQTETADSDVIPAANIAVSSSGSTRTLSAVPVTDKNGVARVAVTVKDAAGKTSILKIDLNVRAVNDEPTINQAASLTIGEDAGQQTVSIGGINSGGSEVQNLTISARAIDKGTDPDDNTNTLITALNLTTPVVLANVATDQVQPLTFSPIAQKFGTSTIIVTVTDNGGTDRDGDNKKEMQFDVTIGELNDRPTFLSGVPDVQMNQDAVFGPLSIGVNDAETPAALLTLAFSSDNTALFPNSSANLEGTGSGINRGLILRPVKGVAGEANVTIALSDDGRADGSGIETTNKVIKVTVTPGVVPVISSIPDQSTKVNTDTGVITFTVTDAQTPAAQIRVTGSADNSTLLPTGNIQFAPVDSANPTVRRIILRPASNQSGSTVVTVTATDKDTPTVNAAVVTFTLTIIGEAPTITQIASQIVSTNGTTGALSFTVADKETFPGFLTVTTSSSDTTFVPAANVVLGGSGGSRTVTVTPAANIGGSSTITVTVNDSEGQSASTTFDVGTPVPSNEAPTISAINNQVTDKGKATSVIPFTIGDADTPGALTLSVTSSNTALVPVGNIFLGGSALNRTVFISLAADQEGVSTITITVSDSGPGTAKSASTSFTLTVAANNAPTISSIADQSTIQNGAIAAVAFTVGDTETAAASLTVAGASDNATLIPTSGIALGGSGANRTVAISPAIGQSGTANVTVTVTDGGGKTASASFAVTVAAPGGVKGDFNGDRQPDLLFQDAGGFLATWFMNGGSLSSATFLLPSNVGDVSFKVAATADFNKDGQEDVLFQGADGTLAVWLMRGADQVSSTLLTPSNPGDANWRVVASGDVNRDGKADLVFQHADGTLAVWYLDGTTLSSAALISPANPGAGWRVVAVGDMNADGKTDLVFQHTDNTLAMWTMDGATLSSAALLEPSNSGAGWKVVAAAPIANRLATSLSGAAQRPTPVTSTATGSGTATLVGDQLTFSISYSGLSGAATAAHIHGTATTEQAAGVLIDLEPNNGGAFGVSGTLSGTITLTSAQVSNVRDGLTYVNIHTAANPGGEIRGQIVADASKAGQVDLIFQRSDLTLAVWLMDGGKLSSAQLLKPSNSGGTWKVVGPK